MFLGSPNGSFKLEPYRSPPQCIIQVLQDGFGLDRKSTRLNSSHLVISYAVFCLKKKKYRRKSTNTQTKKKPSIKNTITIFRSCVDISRTSISSPSSTHKKSSPQTLSSAHITQRV